MEKEMNKKMQNHLFTGLVTSKYSPRGYSFVKRRAELQELENAVIDSLLYMEGVEFLSEEDRILTTQTYKNLCIRASIPIAGSASILYNTKLDYGVWTWDRVEIHLDGHIFTYEGLELDIQKFKMACGEPPYGVWYESQECKEVSQVIGDNICLTRTPGAIYPLYAKIVWENEDNTFDWFVRYTRYNTRGTTGYGITDAVEESSTLVRLTDIFEDGFDAVCVMDEDTVWSALEAYSIKHNICLVS